MTRRIHFSFHSFRTCAGAAFVFALVFAWVPMRAQSVELDGPVSLESLQSLVEQIRAHPEEYPALQEWLNAESEQVRNELESIEAELDRLRGQTPAAAVQPEAPLANEPKVPPPSANPAGIALFQDKVWPLFESKCIDCHGRGKVRGGLDLTTEEGLLRGGDSGILFYGGDPAYSRLYQVIAHEVEPHMPYQKDKLTEEEIGWVFDWIAVGAPYAKDSIKAATGEASAFGVTDKDREFWSFQRLADAGPPSVRNTKWVRNPIDAFIKAGLEESSLTPAPEADRRTLIRRLTFDFLGLPPTPEEIEAFEADDSPEAYEKLVDRLLASPHFGERWGRHWLDVARYADSGGFEFDYERPNAYPYRDFVIRAINDDLPFDQFIRWQVAGDEYEPDNPLAIAATGFCAAGPTVGNQETEKNRFDELDDILSTTSAAFLGLTVACARCHDHKYDAIPQSDYYRMLAHFTSFERTEAFLVDRVKAAEARALESALKKEWDIARAALAAFEDPHRKAILDRRAAELALDATDAALLVGPEINTSARQRMLFKEHGQVRDVRVADIAAVLPEGATPEWDSLKQAVRALDARFQELPPKAYSITDRGKQPAESFLLARGEPHLKKERVEPGYLSVLKLDSDWAAPAGLPQSSSTTLRRAAFAEWLTDVDSGAGRLAARVIVNRLWKHHFGEGLVRTPNDFGIQGDRPSHPELLDWLAGELIRGEWKLKPIHKLIASSAVYRQGTDTDARKSSIDPDNRLLWRRTPLRIESEVLRDAVLAVSGNLNPEMYGKGIFPRMHPDAIATGSTDKWPRAVEDGPATWRRSIYMFVRRSALHPLLTSFDAPDGTASCAQRMVTTVPIQSLQLLNDQFVRDQAAYFAGRLEKELGADAGARIDRAYRLAVGRAPSDQERSVSEQFIAAQMGYYDEDGERRAWTDFCHALFNLNEFLYVD